MFNLRPAAAFVALAAALSSLPALAEEARYNQISLRAEVNQEVQRDLMLVTLYTEAQDSDPAKLAAQITETLNKALGQARQVKDVKIRQGSRNSYPVYDDKGQKITGWRERAELRLESADFAALVKAYRGDADGPENGRHGLLYFAIDPQNQRRRPAQGCRDGVQGSRATGHRSAGRHGLQAGQPEPQYLRLPAALPARAGHDDGEILA